MLFPTLQPLHNQHYTHINYYATSKFLENRDGKQRQIAYSAEILPRLSDAFSPKDDPSDHGQEERQKHLSSLLESRQDASFSHLIGVFAVLARQDQGQEQEGVVGAPYDESPVGAMPEAAHQEYDERVPYHLCPGDAAAAQGDVDIVPEPGGQGDVPPAPELGDVAAEIRHVEVAHQLDPEQLRRSDGDVGVAREVAIDLESEENGGEEQGASALLRVSRKHLVDVFRAVVGHHDFLEQAPQDLPHAVDGGVVVEFALFQELRQ